MNGKFERAQTSLKDMDDTAKLILKECWSIPKISLERSWEKRELTELNFKIYLRVILFPIVWSYAYKQLIRYKSNNHSKQKSFPLNLFLP